MVFLFSLALTQLLIAALLGGGWWRRGPILGAAAIALLTTLGARTSFAAAWFGNGLLALGAVALALVSLVRLLRWSLAPGRDRPAVTLGVAGLVALGGAGARHGLDGFYDGLEAHFAPVLAALQAYHARTHVYPAEAEALVPDYLPVVPTCPGEPRTPELPGPYHHSEPGSPEGFRLTCHTFFVQRYTYDSGLGRWYTWD